MVGNDENIYVEFDYQNCALIDPNKVIDSQGNVKERAVKNENLIMYANLECTLIPRTRLALGLDNNLAKNLISVASVNFLNPGQTGFLTNEYYDEITGLDSTQGNAVNQYKETSSDNPSGYLKQVTKNLDTGLLGITDINIETKVNGFFEVTITMEDYHGRALFEKGEQSPYACFFTFPYPIFYLTVKGFYGKAVKHQLYLKTFTANYSPDSGNFKIVTRFQTYQYSCLQTLPLQHILVLPYMYESKLNITPPPNNGTQNLPVKQISSTRGLQKIKEVFQEYKSKGLVVKTFPEITINEFISRLDTLEKNLMSSFNQQDLSPLTDYENYKFYISQYQKSVFTTPSSFFQKYLDTKDFFVTNEVPAQKIYTFKKEVRETGGATKAIDEIKADIKKYNEFLEKNPTFGLGKPNTINNPISYTTINIDKVPSINYEETYKQRTGKNSNENNKDFETFKLSLENILTSLDVTTGKYYWFKFDGQPNSFLTITENMVKDADLKMKAIEQNLQDRLSKILKSTDNGLGFEPTIRNMIAVIMANCEGFLRLLSEIHNAAWEKRNDPIRSGVIQDKNKTVTSPDLKDFVDINGENLIPVYPWPLFFIEQMNTGGEKYILQYPGDPKYITQTKAYLTEIWPEVEFVEEYMRAMTKRSDNSISFDFTDQNNPNQSVNRISLNSIDFPTTIRFFSNKQETKFLYEIWERVFISAFYQRFGGDNTKKILPQIVAENETINIVNSLSADNPFLIQKLKQYDLNSANYLDYLANVSNSGLGESWQKYIRDIFVTNYVENEVSSSFEILDPSYIDPNNNKINPQPTKIKELSDYLNTTNSNVFTFTDTFPFSIPDWQISGLADGVKATDHKNIMNTTKTLLINDDKKVLSNFNNTTSITQIRPITNFNFRDTNLKLPEPTEDTFDGKNFKTFYEGRIEKDGIKKQLPTEGGIFNKTYNGNISPIQTTSLLNTPYFVNSIIEGVDKFTSGNEYPYVVPAFLFLNSLPLATLREKYKTYENNAQNDLDYIFASLKKFGGVHKLPYAWILKYGSIWHRYKVWKNTQVDILDSCWKNFDAKENYDPITKSDSKEYNLILNGNQESIVLQKTTSIAGDQFVEMNVGFYPKLINSFNIFCRGFGFFSNYTNTEIQDVLNSTGDTIEILYNDQSSFIKPRRYNKNNPDETLRFRTWSCSLLDKKTNVRFVVPSFGSNVNQVKFECFDKKEKLDIPVLNNAAVFNGSIRTLWGLSHYGYFDNSTIDKFSPESYLKTIYSNQEQQESFSFNASVDYTTIEEIFSVFEIDALDKMEVEFLNYCRSMYDIRIIKTGSTTISVIDITKLSINANQKEKNFQLMMVDLLKMESPIQGSSKEYVKEVQTQQFNKLIKNIQSFMEYDEVVKIGNPSGYNRLLFDSFSTVNVVEDKLEFQNYVSGSLPSPGSTTLAASRAAYPTSWTTLETYVGFSSIPGLKYSDNGSYITDFFIDGNIRFGEESVRKLAPLIKIYATKKFLDNSYNWNQFVNDLNDYLRENQEYIDLTLNFIFTNLKKQLPDVTESRVEPAKKSAINSEVLPLSLWDGFKAFNDQWIAGFDYTQKCLMEDVLIIDRASRNIGDKHFFDVFKLKNTFKAFIDTPSNNNVYTLLYEIMNVHEFNTSLRSSFANFYGVLEPDPNVVPKTEGTTEFGNEIFGVFENVDTRKTGPKMAFTLRYQGSKYPDVERAPDVKFKSDAFEFKRVSESPLLDDLVNKTDWGLSNKVVAFNVDAGIRNQNIFKTINVGQEAGKQTIESILANRRNIEKNSGNEFSSQNISLWDFYNYRSYTCQVSCMGNAMIQPDMYFNLKHIPMFTGPYLITQVSHSIKPGSFDTTFKGTRQQMFSFPEIQNYLQNLLKDLFTSIKEKIERKESKPTATSSITADPQSNSANATVTSNGTDCKTRLNDRYKNYVQSTQKQETSTPQEMANLILVKISSPGDESNRIRVMTFITIYLFSLKNNQLICFNNNFCGAQLTLDWGINLNNTIKNEYLCLNLGQDKPYAIFETKEKMVEFTILRWQNFVARTEINTSENIFKSWFMYWNGLRGESDYQKFIQTRPADALNFKSLIDSGLNLAKTLKLIKN